MRARILEMAALSVFSTLVLACGGSDNKGNTTPTPPSTPATGSVAGTVMKGPVNGATVTAYATTNGMMGTQLGQATTDSSGDFTIPIGSYGGPMVLQASGGTYTDEATGMDTSLADGTVITCAVPSLTAGADTGGIQVTPLTTMAQRMAQNMSGGLTTGNIEAANGDIGSYFSIGDIVHTVPMDPTQAGSGNGVSADARNYGMVMAAMSQYAQSLGATSSSGIVTAFADDASDGVMDGMMGSTRIDMGGMGMGMGGGMMSSDAGTTQLGAAMTTFVDSPRNQSGVSLPAMQSLIDQIMGSNGRLMGASSGT